MSNGYLLWHGPSRLVPERDVIVVATGFKNPSINIKTGPMIQTWILDAGEKPTDALKTGHDEAVCGDCPFRGGVCYVQVGQAPNSVWNAWRRGAYELLPEGDYASAFGGRRVRIGAYGDPVAAPLPLWERITEVADGHTGYTHQWRTVAAKGFERFCMASTDGIGETLAAQKAGWRTFRVAQEGGAVSREDRVAREVVCPASGEAGNLITCHDCMACGGTGTAEQLGRNPSPRRSSIVIGVHGSASSKSIYEELRGGAVR